MFPRKTWLSLAGLALLIAQTASCLAAEKNYSTPQPPQKQIVAPSNPLTAEDVVQNNMQKLKSQLALTDVQKPLWAKFESQVKETSASLSNELKIYADSTTQNGTTSPTLPKFLETRDLMIEKRLQNNKKTREALMPLYNALTSDQKATLNKEGMLLLGMFL